MKKRYFFLILFLIVLSIISLILIISEINKESCITYLSYSVNGKIVNCLSENSFDDKITSVFNCLEGKYFEGEIIKLNSDLRICP